MSTSMISIAGMDKAAVLAALYNAARAQGLGALHSEPGDMSSAEAADIVEHRPDVDYVKGRPIKADLSGDSFDPWLYDRDHGAGAAQRALIRAGLLSA